MYGKPLPPLPGQLFWQAKQILLPAGWAFEYAILTEILSSTHIKGKNGLLLYRTEQLAELPAIEHFVKASRAAIRLTNEQLKTIA